MAKIVIDIDDKTYKAFMELIAINLGRSNYKGIIGKCLDAIRHGVVLPKGHSELVYREDVCNELRYMDNNGCITRSVNHVIEDIKKGVKTIIEADRSVENENI